HKAIHNLLEEVERVARAERFEFRGLKKSSGDEESAFEGEFIDSSGDNDDFPPAPDVQLVAGTAWLFAKEDMDRTVDHLVIDEAGRLSSIEECASHSIETGGLTGPGLRYLPVEHEANSRSSPEEADVIAEAIAEMLAGGRFTDQDNATRPLELTDILVVTP